MNKKELREILNFSIELAKKVGKKQIQYQRKLKSLHIKQKEAQGVASTADIESENIILKAIKKKYPEMEILAEESAYDLFGSKKEAYNHFRESPWVWIIDPLDGTNNFLNGLDYFAICISLVQKGKPLVGVVYRPVTGELFYALRGEKSKKINFQGKQKNVSLHRQSNTKKLKNSLLVTGFVSEKGHEISVEFDRFKQLMLESRGIRRMGSAALDMCYVAEGVFDGFWERGLAPWDVSAAGLICEMAGVKVTNYNGQKFNPFDNSILTARNPFYKEFLSKFH